MHPRSHLRALPRGITHWLLAVLIAVVPPLGQGVAYAHTDQQSAPWPQPVVSWFFAEGSTQAPFDTWFLVQNPTDRGANVTFTFQLQTFGNRTMNVIRSFVVGPRSRFSLFANEVVPNVPFSTRIDADQAVFAERAMYVGFDGTVVPGIPSPSRVWLFAEGSTQNPFHTWLLIQNPNDQVGTATVTYLLEGGRTTTQTVHLPPRARASVFVNEVLPNVAFSSRVESTLPIVAERAMYRFPGNAATGVAGVNAPSRTWYFADGRNIFFRQQDADTWLLLQNPNASPVAATVTFFSSEGVVQSNQFTLPPASRESIFVEQFFRQPAYGIRVEATGDIIAERSVFVASPRTGGEPRGAYATTGATRLGTVWAFPEGSTAPPYMESIIVLNPNSQTMDVRFDVMLPNGQVVTRNVTVEPNRRSEVSINGFVPNTAVSALVTTSLPSVAERIMAFRKDDNMGFHDTIGIRLQ